MFLSSNEGLTKLTAQNLTTVGNHFLASNTALTELSAQNLTTVGIAFLSRNKHLKSFLHFIKKLLKSKLWQRVCMIL